MARLQKLYNDTRRERIAQLDIERITEHREKTPKRVLKCKWLKYHKV